MSQHTILIINDDEISTATTRTILEDRGYITIYSPDGEDGLEKAIQQQPEAILLETSIPKINNNEVLNHLKEAQETKDIPVIIMSKDNDITAVASHLKMGANDYIVRPFNNENLIARLKNLIKTK